jgi:two-component system sensor histidine kinase UhpB
VDLNFVPLPDERGAVIGGMVIARDITEQRQAQRQLLASRRQLAEAQRIAQVESWEWEVDKDEASMSDEMSRILGLPPGSQVRMRDVVTRFIHPADLDRVLAHMERMPTDPTPFTVRSVLVRGEGTVDEDGLEAALREEAKAACNRAALVTCEIVSELEGRLDPVVETALFRVAQQALANVVDHAQATHVLVTIECSDLGVVLRVSDDGCGFDPDHVQVLADVAHFGLIAMRERVEALGGRFRVTTAPGKGTVVEAKLPLTDPAEGSGA